jgi:hypothetical protein
VLLVRIVAWSEEAAPAIDERYVNCSVDTVQKEGVVIMQIVCALTGRSTLAGGGMPGLVLLLIRRKLTAV